MNAIVTVSVNQIDTLKDELDDYIASECIYCGDVMIKSIAEPFISPEDQMDIASWYHLSFLSSSASMRSLGSLFACVPSSNEFCIF